MEIVDRLLSSDEPSVVWKTKKYLLGIDDPSVRSEIPKCKRVRKLLSEQNKDGLIPHHVYSKWYGSHWVLMHLAELGYPENDPDIWPMVDYTLEKWFRATENKGHLTMIDGRPRRCASQEANICWSAMKLGFMDDRIHELIKRLISWQWDDGGWNCDKNPTAINSSFHESAIPLRAISLYADKAGDTKAKESAKRVSEIFLKRKLYKKQNSDEVMFNRIDKIGIPATWHYDFFFGLKVMAESGFITDPRCNDALGLLESKRLPDGGFPAEYRYYSLWDGKKEKRASGTSLVDWSPVSKKVFNPFVTVDALHVLKVAGRI
ncbi:MAG: hypothetical protein KA140_06450 [Caldisericia bacterium]|nr:hypothetical protein [Caldisericia bacterium]